MKKDPNSKEIVGPHEPINIIHVQSHGLLKGEPVMYGDDNGGQLTYVLGAARAQVKLNRVMRVDIHTRVVSDSQDSYASTGEYEIEIEPIGKKDEHVRIIRSQSSIEFLPQERKDSFLRKEDLWPTLSEAAEKLVEHIKNTYKPEDRIILQLHYADAGFAGTKAIEQLRKEYYNIVSVFVGHSLGHDKFNKLMAAEENLRPIDLEMRYNITARIAAEATALENCDVLVTNSEQELKAQYLPYKLEFNKNMKKVPVWPGIDHNVFKPRGEANENFEECLLGKRIFGKDPLSLIGEKYKSFDQPNLVPVITVCRPNDRKNILRLVEAFAENDELCKNHNLLLVLGSRPESGKLTDKEEVLYFEKLKTKIAEYPQLEGKIVCPSRHDQGDIPKLMRWAADKKGVFVNPALTEPFGLTLIEAGACGLPVVATKNGGPSEIMTKCEHGVLVDPVNTGDIAKGLLTVLSLDNWEKYSNKGLKNIPEQTNPVKNAAKVIETCEIILNERNKHFFTQFEEKRKSVCRALGVPYVLRAAYYNTKQTRSEQEPFLPKLNRTFSDLTSQRLPPNQVYEDYNSGQALEDNLPNQVFNESRSDAELLEALTKVKPESLVKAHKAGLRRTISTGTIKTLSQKRIKKPTSLAPLR